MNFNFYIQRQKQLIRERHEGEEFITFNHYSAPLKSSEQVIEEMKNLRGLNAKERELFGFKSVKRGAIIKREFA